LVDVASEATSNHGLTFASCPTRSVDVSDGPLALLRSLVTAYSSPPFATLLIPKSKRCETLRLGLVLCGSEGNAMRARHAATIETEGINSESVRITIEDCTAAEYSLPLDDSLDGDESDGSTAEYALPLDDSLDGDKSVRRLHDLVLGLAGTRGCLYGFQVGLTNNWCMFFGENVTRFPYGEWSCAVRVVKIDTGRAARAEAPAAEWEPRGNELSELSELSERSAEEPSAGSSSPESGPREARCAVS
jgi:hypothetical protein